MYLSKFIFRYYNVDIPHVFLFCYSTLMCMNIVLDAVLIIMCLVWKIIWVNGAFDTEVW